MARNERITTEQLTKLAKELPSKRDYDEKCGYHYDDVTESEDLWYTTLFNPDNGDWVDIAEDTGEILRYGDPKTIYCYDHRLSEHRLAVKWVYDLITATSKGA